MIIFSTKFYVTKELTKEKFIDMAFEWINGSPHYEFSNIKWTGESVYEEKTKNQEFSLVESSDSKIIALRLENTDPDNVIWTNDFVFVENENQNILLVRLARDAADKEIFISQNFNRPRLMKEIIKKGYGANDNNLPISDQAIVIDRSNIKIAEEIICGQTKYLLPIVYVTRRFTDNNTILDIKELAKDLAGTAHVLIEESTELSTELKEKTDGINPFNGAVHIYYTDKVGSRLIPDEFCSGNSFRFQIVRSVCQRLAQVKIDDKYTWGTIRYQRLLEKYRQDQQKSTELEKTCEDILKLKEKEHKEILENIEVELNELRSKVQTYEYALQNKKQEKHGNIVFDCHEREFFDSEIKNLILKLLKKEVQEMSDDPNQRGWRKYHVLKAILDDNIVVGKGEQLERELKNILSNVEKLTSKDKKRLAELGFVTLENKHNKLYFHGDKRYMITLGKTPGDSRAALNSSSIAIQTIIC